MYYDLKNITDVQNQMIDFAKHHLLSLV